MRELKDAISLDVLDDLDKAGIDIASGTYEIVAMPPVQVNVSGNGTVTRA